MALGSTQPLTEMSTRSISWGKGGRCVRLTTLPPSYVVMKSVNLNFLEPSGPLQACNGTAVPFYWPTTHMSLWTSIMDNKRIMCVNLLDFTVWCQPSWKVTRNLQLSFDCPQTASFFCSPSHDSNGHVGCHREQQHKHRPHFHRSKRKIQAQERPQNPWKISWNDTLCNITLKQWFGVVMEKTDMVNVTLD